MKNKNFWEELKEFKTPILALAPMAGFTDSAFRSLCREEGADVLYSEMASAAALYYADVKNADDTSSKVTMELLRFNPERERPYVVQIFGSEAKHFAFAAKEITEKIKPDGIDINFGCPVPKVIKQRAGAALMQDLKRSREIIEAVLANTHLPVSIKIRAASGSVRAEEFLENISDLQISALMIHGRTLKQGFVGEVDYDLVKRARAHFKGVILANGGINTLSDAREALALSEADGLGLARGILGRPWLFKEIKANKEINLANKEVLDLMVKQAEHLVELKGEAALVELRKHLAWYAKGLKNAKFLRENLVKVESLEEIKNIIKTYQEKYDLVY